MTDGKYYDKFKFLPKILRGKILDKLAAKRAHKNLDNPELITKLSDCSLPFNWVDIHSQRGKDGILVEVFHRLEIRTGLFFEFGA